MNSGSIYSFIFNEILNLTQLLIAGVLFIFYISKIRMYSFLFYYIFSVIFITIAYLCHNINISSSIYYYIFFLLKVFSIIVLISYCSVIKFNIKFFLTSIFYILTVHSFFGFILQFFVPSEIFFRIQIDGIKTESFLGLFYYSVATDSDSSVYRSSGIMWEPGMMQLYCNLSLYYYLFENKSKLKSIISFSSLLSTFSTTGYIISIFLIFFKIKSKLIALFICSLTIIVFTLLFHSVFIEKLSLNSLSLVSRLYDLEKGFYLSFISPIIGLSFDIINVYQNYNYTSNYGSIFPYNFNFGRSITNSFFISTIMLGYPVTFYLFHQLYNQGIFKYKLPFAVLIILSLLSLPIFTTSLFILFFFSSFNCRKLNHV